MFLRHTSGGIKQAPNYSCLELSRKAGTTKTNCEFYAVSVLTQALHESVKRFPSGESIVKRRETKIEIDPEKDSMCKGVRDRASGEVRGN